MAGEDLESAPGAGHGPSAAGDPSQAVEGRRMSAALDRLIADLPEELHTCWVLYAYERLSYREISRIVAVPESTVRGRIARARGRLAEGMSAWT